MSIASEISRLQTAKADLKTAIEGKGVTVPSDATLDDYPDLVDSISGGGGNELEEFLDAQISPVRSSLSYVRAYTFGHYVSNNSLRTPKDLEIDYPNLTHVYGYAFSSTTLKTEYFPELISITGASNFNNCQKLKNIVIPKATNIPLANFVSNGQLLSADFRSVQTIGVNQFRGCSKLALVVLGYNGVVSIGGMDVFVNTPFDNGKAGGDIYIPKAIYDHLGDGTALDYKAATNWSAYDSYGTITWHPIENSYYETHYSNGMEIPLGGAT